MPACWRTGTYKQSSLVRNRMLLFARHPTFHMFSARERSCLWPKKQFQTLARQKNDRECQKQKQKSCSVFDEQLVSKIWTQMSYTKERSPGTRSQGVERKRSLSARNCLLFIAQHPFLWLCGVGGEIVSRISEIWSNSNMIGDAKNRSNKLAPLVIPNVRPGFDLRRVKKSATTATVPYLGCKVSIDKELPAAICL